MMSNTIKNISNVLIEDIQSLKKDFKNIYITISSTAGNDKTYLTPIRLFENCAILGVVCKDEIEAKEIAISIDGNVDYIFVDIEKKLAPKISDYGDLISNNIYHPIYNAISNSIVLPFMPNDITVEAAWKSLVTKILELKDAKVMIIGLGNIGSKLCLKLVESGVRVYGVPRDSNHKSATLETTINNIKHKGAIGYLKIIDDLNKAIIMSDIIVFSASEPDILDKKYLKVLKTKRHILTIGRNNIPQELAVKLSNIRTLDVGFDLLKNLEGIIDIIHNQNKVLGDKKKMGNILEEGEELWYDYHKPYVGGKLTQNGFIRYTYNEIK
jgi:hypothetical protein